MPWLSTTITHFIIEPLNPNLMAFHKTNLYPLEDQILASYAMGFKHPARIAILRQLSEEHCCYVEQINQNHQLSQPAISGHLDILYGEAHFVQYRERFPYIFYSLDYEEIRKAEEFFHKIFRKLLG